MTHINEGQPGNRQPGNGRPTKPLADELAEALAAMVNTFSEVKRFDAKRRAKEAALHQAREALDRHRREAGR